MNDTNELITDLEVLASYYTTDVNGNQLKESETLERAVSYIKTMGEIEAAATEISFNGEQFMHKIYRQKNLGLIVHFGSKENRHGQTNRNNRAAA